MNTFLSGPQEFDASNLPSAAQITADYAVIQAYIPTTQPLTAVTGGGANQATINIAAFLIQYPFDANNDGAPDLVSYNSGSLTPLLDNTLYYVFFDDPTYAGGAQAYQASTQSPSVVSGLHRQYIGSITTPVFGGGGTGGTTHCFSGNTRVWTRRGVIPISEVMVGDRVLSRVGWRPVIEVVVTEYSGPMHDMGKEELVRAEHRFWKNAHKTVGEWLFARDLFPNTVPFSGKVYNLKLGAAKRDAAHSYLLGNHWFVHNMKVFP